MEKRGFRLLSILFIFSLILIQPLFAGEEWMYNSENIEMEIIISSSFTISPTSGDFQIEYVSSTLSFIPEDDFQQEVIAIQLDPDTKIQDSSAEFRWDKPTAMNFEYSLQAGLKNHNRIKRVQKKIPFPITDTDMMEYTAQQDVIDSGDAGINRIASGLAAGEDDLYIVAVEIAGYVMDIVDYDQSNKDVAVGTKTASWVLENRVGVCDEMTSLFMAMVRSIGIPAKYVSGMAYTNLNGMNDWGPHAWAEVYFPGVGWVPFDVTYGELGFIDATHIKLKESLDADESSTEYEWRGRSIDIDTNELDIDVSLKSKGRKLSDNVALKSSFEKEKIGFGSYNLLEVEVENLNPYYLATEISLSQNLELEVVGSSRQFVALPPNGKKTLYWIIKISENLDKNFIYTIPITSYSTRNVTSEASFQSKKGLPVFSKQDIQKLLSNKQEESEKTYSRDLSVDCDAGREEFLIYETIDYECSLKNQGNQMLDDIEVCLEEDCTQVDIGIGQIKVVIFKKKYEDTGEKELLVSAKNSLVTRYDNDYIKIMDEASIGIEGLKYPADVMYSEEFEISFIAERKSTSIPENVNIEIMSEGFSKTWELKAMEANQKYIIKVKGQNFHEGLNDVKITIDYTDELGKPANTEKTFQISLVNVTFFQKVMIKLFSFEDWLLSFFE